MERRIVLVIAHAVVAQPRVWRRWAEGGAVDVVFHCPEAVPAACGDCAAFVADRRLPLPFGRTRWGEASIVRETLRAYACLLERHAEPFLVFLASGHCVPLVPPRTLVERFPYRTRFGDMYHNVDDFPITQQWNVLTRESCERAVAHYADPAAFEAEAVACALRGVPPDNRFFMDALPLQLGEPRPITADFCNEPLLLYTQPRVETVLSILLYGKLRQLWASPIEWDDMNTPRYSGRISEKTEPAKCTWSLRELLLWLRLHGDVVFFRKVTPCVLFDEELMSLLYGESVPREAILAALGDATAVAAPECAAALRVARCSAAFELRRQRMRGPDIPTLQLHMRILRTRAGRALFRRMDFDKHRLTRLIDGAAPWVYVAFALACTVRSHTLLSFALGNAFFLSLYLLGKFPLILKSAPIV